MTVNGFVFCESAELKWFIASVIIRGFFCACQRTNYSVFEKKVFHAVKKTIGQLYTAKCRDWQPKKWHQCKVAFAWKASDSFRKKKGRLSISDLVKPLVEWMGCLCEIFFLFFFFNVDMMTISLRRVHWYAYLKIVLYLSYFDFTVAGSPPDLLWSDCKWWRWRNFWGGVRLPVCP